MYDPGDEIRRNAMKQMRDWMYLQKRPCRTRTAMRDEENLSSQLQEAEVAQ